MLDLIIGMTFTNNKTLCFFLFVGLLVYPSSVHAQSQSELEQRVNVEIRDTHILIVHLFQTEINGELTRSGSLMPMYFHRENRIIAQSVVKTKKSLTVIKSDIQNALDRIDPNTMGIEQGIPWSAHPNNSNEKWSYWTFTDNTSKAKIYFEIMYKMREKEILFTSYPYDF
jgi:hypothetical protein